MASNVHVSAVARNAMIDALAVLLNGGFADIYDGTQPANAGVAVGVQTKLGRLTFNATAFGAASGGSATANAITSDSDADAGGTPSWARLLKSDGTVVTDCSVGTSGCDITVSAATIVQHGIISASAATLSIPA